MDVAKRLPVSGVEHIVKDSQYKLVRLRCHGDTSLGRASFVLYIPVWLDFVLQDPAL